MARELADRLYRFGEFELDTSRRLLTRAGRPVALSAKALDLLAVFVENGGRVLSKDELLEKVWPGQFVEEANLTVQVSALRKALGERKEDHRYVVTVPGRGYRFVAEVETKGRAPGAAAVVVETETTAELVVEEEFEVGAGDAARTAVGDERLARARALSAAASPGRGRRLSPWLAASLGVVLAAACAVVAWVYLGRHRDEDDSSPAARAGAAVVPFARTSVRRLTNSGSVGGAALTADGKFIAYVLKESAGSSLWVQQVETARDLRVVPPTKGEFWSLTFSPDGAYLYYFLFTHDESDLKLFRVAALGGPSWRVPNVVGTSVTFAPDGRRFAYVRPDSSSGQNLLMVADADGTNQRAVAARRHPDTFGYQGQLTAWSPDGETIACVVYHTGPEASYSSVVGVSARDGTETPLSARRWYGVNSIEWLKDGSGLLVAGGEKSGAGTHVWLLPRPGGEPRRLTNDLGQYGWLSAGAGGRAFVAVQTNTAGSVFVGEAGARAEEFREAVSEVGPLSPLAWTPDGRLVFRSNKSGGSELWTADAGGANRRQLTSGARVSELGLCVSPDGRHLVFASWRSGRSSLWRADADGSGLTQLTDGEADAHPRCTPDGRAVVFQRGLVSDPSVWRVPLAGGAAERLTALRAKWPAVSPDGRRVAYLHTAGDRWHVGVVPVTGGADTSATPPASLSVPATFVGPVLAWAADGQSLLYMNVVGGVGNVWALPLDGSPPSPLTRFNAQLVEDFALAPDGRRLAVNRSRHLSDVVLIESREGE